MKVKSESEVARCDLMTKQQEPTRRGISGGLVVKNPSVYAGDTGSIPGSGRSPGDENSNPIQYSCLENHMDRGASKVENMKYINMYN